MEKKRLFFQFVWSGATRLSSRTAPLCSPLLTDSLSQEAQGLYACPQKILNPQGWLILAAPGVGVYFLRQSTTSQLSLVAAGFTSRLKLLPPG